MTKIRYDLMTQAEKILALRELFASRGIPKIGVTFSTKRGIIIHISGRDRFRQKDMKDMVEAVNASSIQWMLNKRTNSVNPSSEEVIFKSHLQRKKHKSHVKSELGL